MDDHSASTVALFAIHPRHANSILSGKKTVEFRKIRPRTDITHIVLYVTDPIRKVVAVLEIDDIVQGCPKDIWKRFEHAGGIEESEFLDYYSGSECSVVYMIGEVTELRKPITLKRINGKAAPPQSYEYVSPKVLKLFSRI